jgi:hypothetical protein
MSEQNQLLQVFKSAIRTYSFLMIFIRAFVQKEVSSQRNDHSGNQEYNEDNDSPDSHFFILTLGKFDSGFGFGGSIATVHFHVRHRTGRARGL